MTIPSSFLEKGQEMGTIFRERTEIGDDKLAFGNSYLKGRERSISSAPSTKVRRYESRMRCDGDSKTWNNFY